MSRRVILRLVEGRKSVRMSLFEPDLDPFPKNLRRRMSINIGGMRSGYLGNEDAFTEDQLIAKEPFAQFDDWFALATSTPAIIEPNAMCLATATKDGRPSCRMVLLKGYGEEGFKFFTNGSSRKGKELKENGWAALNFHWEPLRRCVRIEGQVEELSVEESTEYFESRPLTSQVGAYISRQSSVVESREVLLEREKAALENVCEGRGPGKPSDWGGFIVVPHTIEFWQGQTNRIHDRIRFRKFVEGQPVDSKVTHMGDKGWVFERLEP